MLPPGWASGHKTLDPQQINLRIILSLSKETIDHPIGKHRTQTSPEIYAHWISAKAQWEILHFTFDLISMWRNWQAAGTQFTMISLEGLQLASCFAFSRSAESLFSVNLCKAVFHQVEAIPASQVGNPNLGCTRCTQNWVHLVHLSVYEKCPRLDD